MIIFIYRSVFDEIKLSLAALRAPLNGYSTPQTPICESLDCTILCKQSDGGLPQHGVTGGAWQECKNQMTSNGNSSAVGVRQAISLALINTPFCSSALFFFFSSLAQHRLYHAPNVGLLPGFGPIGWDARSGPTSAKENDNIILKSQSYNFHMLITQKQRWAKYIHLGL